MEIKNINIDKEELIVGLLGISYSVWGFEQIENLMKRFLKEEEACKFPAFASDVKKMLEEQNAPQEDKIKFNALIKLGLEKVEKALLFDYNNDEEEE